MNDSELSEKKMTLNETRYLPLDYDILTEDLRTRAETELNETPAHREMCLEKLKSMIGNNEACSVPMDDIHLLRFLRARRFDVQNSYNLLLNYHSYKRQHPQLFENYTPSAYKHVMEINMANFLPFRTPIGCSVWVVQVGKWDTQKVSFYDVLSFGLLCAEKDLELPISEICGLVSIVDCQGLGLKHILELTPSKIGTLIGGIQDTYPIRHKEIHVINNYAIFQFLFKLLSPLLSSKMRSRVFFHGSNLSSLHKYIPADILPEEYGGKLGQFENNKFYEALLSESNSEKSER